MLRVRPGRRSLLAGMSPSRISSSRVVLLSPVTGQRARGRGKRRNSGSPISLVSKSDDSPLGISPLRVSRGLGGYSGFMSNPSFEFLPFLDFPTSALKTRAVCLPNTRYNLPPAVIFLIHRPRSSPNSLPVLADFLRGRHKRFFDAEAKLFFAPALAGFCKETLSFVGLSKKMFRRFQKHSPHFSDVSEVYLVLPDLG